MMTDKKFQETKPLFLEAYKKTLFFKHAAWASGVSESAAHLWKKQGELDLEEGIESEYSSFTRDLRKIRAEKISERLDRIERAGNAPEYWGASVWILEKLSPGDFGKDSQSLQELQVQMASLKDLFENYLKQNSTTIKEIPLEIQG